MSISLTFLRFLLESRFFHWLIIGRWYLLLLLPVICFFVSVLGSLLGIILYTGLGGKKLWN